MTENPAFFSRIKDKLGFQLAFILALVLLPLAFISFLKSSALVHEIQARTEAALLGETMQAAVDQLQPIQQARGATEILAATIRPLLTDNAACSLTMAQIAAENPKYSLIAFVPLNGQMRCSSTGKFFDFSANPLFQEILKQPEPNFVVNRNGPVSGTSILGITYPVFDEQGAYAGIVSMSIPHQALLTDASPENNAMPLALITFDRDGDVLTSTTGLDDLDFVPSDRTLQSLVGSGPTGFTARAKDGLMRTYSVVPLVAGELYALGARLTPSVQLMGQQFLSVPLMLPALMWFASLTAAWLAVDRLVSRNVRKLSKSIEAFAGGSRVVNDVNFGPAPMEIRNIAESYVSMTESIIRNEAELENTIHQKEVLLREVHHRVKNNLQLIASIMSMQIRRVKSTESKQILIELRDRVMSLATIHRGLFETAGRVDVHSDELLSEIIDQFSRVGQGNGHKFVVRKSLATIRLVPDQAVPLGLLVTEALTGAIKHGTSPDEAGVQIDITLKPEGEAGAILEIANSSDVSETAQSQHSGLGTQLTTAFVLQMGGKLERRYLNGKHHMRVTFPVRPLTDAESRTTIEQVA